MTSGFLTTARGLLGGGGYVAKMRAVRRSQPPLMRTNMGAGHGGASGRYDALRDLDYITLQLNQVGITSGGLNFGGARGVPAAPRMIFSPSGLTLIGSLPCP